MKKTNADIIRAMTDEELAYAIMCPRDIDGTGLYGCEDSGNAAKCYECALKWLREEREDGQTT